MEGKSLSPAWVYQKVTSRFRYSFTWAIGFAQTLVLSLHTFHLQFLEDPETLFCFSQDVKLSCLSLLFFST